MDDLTVQAVTLGILQGLTEFLPVSSSGHLLILPWLWGWEPLGLTFDVMLHSGTLLAVVLYFRAQLWEMLRNLPRRFQGLQSEQEDLLVPLLVGTLPGGLVGVLLGGTIEAHLRTPWVVVVTLSSIGLLLLWADRKTSGTRAWESINWKTALWIGGAQALALVPGVSRSGITIIAALLLGLSRPDAARFSFLLAIPLIAGATGLELLDLSLEPAGQGVPLVPLLAGVVSSFVSGFLCVKYFLRFLQSRSFLPFVIYRLLLSAVIVWWLLA